MRIYQDMKLDFKRLTKKELLKSRAMLLGLMSVHFYALHWMFSSMANAIPASFLILLLCTIFGFAVRGWFDNLYEVKVTERTLNLLK
ncbi:hypothetical protein PP175_27665 (plasmid) [Aneurinibacillus sp. Ricciae_BoGa-3]|uniref:hypothetical protein n=1 Tax=Aneurinibacillus sp. Ricciae_BoGa-3 TaxID=3022697 RepID=UPI002340267F|nr:hypothetical protein [Aneurinibacillus sp. Ricciae_BoGa-3]WCK56972.1 hypothetical protein PP175_27665 [Aneurinibacillus sp. Ricciae_BoGa-3]